MTCFILNFLIHMNFESVLIPCEFNVLSLKLITIPNHKKKII
jgi:hypothetical protein